jgi:hypothetical protein
MHKLFRTVSKLHFMIYDSFPNVHGKMNVEMTETYFERRHISFN